MAQDSHPSPATSTSSSPSISTSTSISNPSPSPNPSSTTTTTTTTPANGTTAPATTKTTAIAATAATTSAHKSARSTVQLVPWDPESPTHVHRLYEQRVACGWKQDKIEGWRVLQREGRMAIHWVILSPDDADYAARLLQHTNGHPAESSPLTDTAATLAGQPRTTPLLPTSFVPIGHISLDFSHEDASLADPAKGIFYISTLYISRALQGGGLGRAAMDAVEAMACGEPLRAKVLALDTLAGEQSLDQEFWEGIGWEAPKISNQHWYERRGYQVFKHDDSHYVEYNPTGGKRVFSAVFMKKTIG